MSEAAQRLYFAYGSNLYLPRMTQRVPSAVPLGVAQLPGYRLTFDKLADCGSTKCTIEATEEEAKTVWGTVYRIDPAEQPRLDEAEGPDYEIIDIEVCMSAGERLAVFTYRARPECVGSGSPFVWYRDLVLQGARQHALPADYVNRIAQVTAIPDPNTARARANRPRPW